MAPDTAAPREHQRMTLTEFLLARIDEDEAEILAAKTDDPFTPYGQHWSEVPFAAGAATRLVVDLDAKRRIVCQVSNVSWGGYAVRDTVLRLLALPYTGHPDYRNEWSS